MRKLVHGDLYPLERYAQIRPEFRQEVMKRKKSRRVPIGPHATLYFEDRLTIQYQIQEMLRAERVFEPEGIEEELAAYNPLIPDGTNWKATLMLEYEDVGERKMKLRELVGIEDRVWVRVDGFERVWAVADEDMDREDEEKTSSVHFLRFELSSGMIEAVKNGSAVSMGIDHGGYRFHAAVIPEEARRSLAGDF